MTTSDVDTIITVDGPIEPADLGTTLTHEHAFIDMRNWLSEPDSVHDRQYVDEPLSLENLRYIRRNPMSNRDNLILSSMEEAIDEIGDYARAGGNSIIDVTPKGSPGQDPVRVREIGRELGIQFIQGTAYYVRSGHPDRIDEMTGEEIEAEFVSDIRNGIDDTDVRAGIVGEIGLSVDDDGEMYDEELKVLRAGARAALRTGSALTIHPPGRTAQAQRNHTYPTSRWSLEVLDIVEEEGLPPDRVILDHMDRTFWEHLEYQKELASRGAYLEYDLIGTELKYDEWVDGYPSDKWRAESIHELIQDGHGSRIVIGHDICLKIQRKRYGGFGYDHILKNFLPLLREHGVSTEQIEEILIENPKRVLTFEEPAE